MEKYDLSLFSAVHPPITDPVLALNGSSHGAVNLVCVPSRGKRLAPKGKTRSVFHLGIQIRTSNQIASSKN